MARYKPQERNSLLLPVVLSEQIIPGSFAFALNYLVDHELDLSALDAQFKNDELGASAYDPRVMLKVVLLAYSQGLISSRTIEQRLPAQRPVHRHQRRQPAQPYPHRQVRASGLSEQIKPLFSQVLMTCDAQGLIGRDMFAIDGVKLPSNASKERSGTHAELRHRADRAWTRRPTRYWPCTKPRTSTAQEEPLDAQTPSPHGSPAQRSGPHPGVRGQQPAALNRKGQELKTNVTDPQSAKMATNKGVIQGYAAQAVVDSAHQVIVAADVTGSGSEQSMLLPMIEQSAAYRDGTHVDHRRCGLPQRCQCCAIDGQGHPGTDRRQPDAPA
jgi:transposase